MGTFTHLTRNRDGFEEAEIEIDRTFWGWLLGRPRVKTFVKLKHGWSYKDSGLLISDDDFKLLTDNLWSMGRYNKC